MYNKERSDADKSCICIPELFLCNLNTYGQYHKQLYTGGKK
jgi:hypothetical protein